MIRKRGSGDTWYSDFAIWEGGKRRRVRRSLRTTNRLEALARANELKAQLQEAILRRSPRFDHFAKRYMEYAWSEKPRSALREQQRLAKVKLFFAGLGIKYLDDITPYHIEQLKAKLKAQNLAPITVNHYLQLLRGMLNMAIKWEVYDKGNPARKVRFLKPKPRRKITALTPYQEKRVLAVSREISRKPASPLQAEWYTLVVFTLNTGLRMSEVLNLKWRDVKGEMIHVAGKGDKDRTVPLNKAALQIIATRPRYNSYVFNVPNRHVQTVFQRTTERVKRESRVTFFTFHILRHTFTTRLLEAGVDIITIAALLGHSKLTMTLHYGHSDERKMGDAVSRLGGV